MKTIYLLDTKGDFIVFGVGMFLADSQDNSIKVGVLAGNPVAGFCISSHDTPEASTGARAAWIQAIIAASDGALLRWDADTQSVVDELAQDDSVFADEPIDTQSGPVAVHDPPNLTSALHRSETWTGCEILRGAA